MNNTIRYPHIIMILNDQETGLTKLEISTILNKQNTHYKRY